MLDIWPELPIVIEGVEGVDNVIAALELNDRVSRIDLWNFSSSELERIVEAMQDPFPVLTDLWLWSTDGMAPVISDSFLGGFAPRLQLLRLESIPCPALPRLLSSATDLVHLYLEDLPHSGYISPKGMVTCLSALTRLESLILRFQSPRSRPDRASRLSPPLTRTILPALTYLRFKGVTEYLEELVTQIDAPLLKHISIVFCNQLIFNISQLTKFLCRTEMFTVLDQATVSFSKQSIIVELAQRTGTNSESLKFSILSRKLDWQLSSLAQVCNSAFPTLSTLEHLNLGHNIYCQDPFSGQDDIENIQWLELLHPFGNVKNLHLSEKVVPCIGPTLQELTGERATEVVPALQNIFLDGFEASLPVEDAIGQFVSARQFSGHPVAIHPWGKMER